MLGILYAKWKIGIMLPLQCGHPNALNGPVQVFNIQTHATGHSEVILLKQNSKVENVNNSSQKNIPILRFFIHDYSLSPTLISCLIHLNLYGLQEFQFHHQKHQWNMPPTIFLLINSCLISPMLYHERYYSLFVS